MIGKELKTSMLELEIIQDEVSCIMHLIPELQSLDIDSSVLLYSTIYGLDNSSAHR